MDQASGQNLLRKEVIDFNFFCFTTMEKSLAFTQEFCMTLRTLKQEEVYLWVYKIFSDLAERVSCFTIKYFKEDF